jgi:putative transposase
LHFRLNFKTYIGSYATGETSGLRSIEILCNMGKTVAEAVRQSEISEQTYYKWRNKYGGMNVSDAKRLKELEKENGRLKKLVAELSLDNAILRDVNSKNF